MQLICYILCIGLLFVSCKKENQTSLDYAEIKSGTNHSLRCIYKFNNDTLFAGGGNDTRGIILISKNAGTHWELYSQSLISRVNSVFFRNAMQGFAACNNFLLMQTNDGGLHWDSIQQYHVPYQYQTNLYAIKFVNDSVGYFCGGEEYSHGIIGKTVNRGQSWYFTFVDHELRTIDFKDNQHGYCGGYGAMYYTNDGGENWQLTASNNEFITSINLTSVNGVACGYEGGILKNNNTIDWEKILNSNSAFSTRSHFNTVCTNDNNNYFIFGNEGKCALSNDAGNTWKQATTFDNKTIYDAVMLAPTSGIAVGEEGKIFRFTK